MDLDPGRDLNTDPTRSRNLIFSWLSDFFTQVWKSDIIMLVRFLKPFLCWFYIWKICKIFMKAWKKKKINFALAQTTLRNQVRFRILWKMSGSATLQLFPRDSQVDEEKLQDPGVPSVPLNTTETPTTRETTKESVQRKATVRLQESLRQESVASHS